MGYGTVFCINEAQIKKCIANYYNVHENEVKLETLEDNIGARIDTRSKNWLCKDMLNGTTFTVTGSNWWSPGMTASASSTTPPFVIVSELVEDDYEDSVHAD